MRPFHVPEPADRQTVLQMENDLLAHENRILRARVEGIGPSAEPSTDTDAATAGRDAEDYERFRQAYHDLRWFVRRLDASPAGPVLRRWAGFRTLRARYGPDVQ